MKKMNVKKVSVQLSKEHFTPWNDYGTGHWGNTCSPKKKLIVQKISKKQIKLLSKIIRSFSGGKSAEEVLLLKIDGLSEHILRHGYYKFGDCSE